MTNSKHDLIPGLNDPSPVSRVLIFDYYDGAIGGVVQFGDGGPVYRFDMTDDTQTADPERTYLLRRLPPDSLDRLSGIIGEHIEPVWPVWLPLWKFPTAEIQSAVDSRIDAILEQAEEPAWRIVTSDLVSFTPLVAEPVRVAAHAGRFGKYGA